MRTILLPLLAVLGVMTACAQPAGDATSPAPSSPSDGADAELTVEIDPGNGSPTETYTLVCGSPAEGTHPDAEAACEHLRAMEEPFEPLAADLMCTEQYGGPQTARISGVWSGEPVDLELSRVDGCAIAQWDGLGPVLPGPVGLAPPSDD